MFLEGIFQKWKVQWGQEFLLTRKEVGGINLFSNDHCIANDDNNKLFKVSKLPEIEPGTISKRNCFTVLITTIRLEKVLGKNVQESGDSKIFQITTDSFIHSFVGSSIHFAINHMIYIYNTQ